MNIFTTTNKHTLWVEDAENQRIAVEFSLAQRWGATPTMIADTVRHFAFACAVWAAGINWNPDHEKFQEYNTRADYEARELVDPAHFEPFVQIFTNDFPIWNATARNGEGALERYPLNIMTEETSAGAIYEAFVDMITAWGDVEEICNRLKPEAASQKPASAPTQHGAKSQGQSELDRHFGAKQEPAPAIVGPADVPKGVTLIHGAPLIQSWDYKLEDTYAHLFQGVKVAVEIGKVARSVQAKKDGSGAYEVIQFFPYRDGQVRDKDPFCLRVFVNDTDTGYDWHKFKKDNLVYFPAAGISHEGSGIATFKVTKSKTDDRVFWNFVELKFDEPLEPVSDTITDQREHEDIPF